MRPEAGHSVAVHLSLLLCQRMAHEIFDHSFKGNLSNTILSLIRRKAVKLPYFCGATFGVFLFQDPINHPAITLHIPPPNPSQSTSAWRLQALGLMRQVRGTAMKKCTLHLMLSGSLSLGPHCDFQEPPKDPIIISSLWKFHAMWCHNGL